MTDGVRELIAAIAEGDSVAIESAFNSEMAARISTRLDDMRIEVAQNMFATEEVEHLDEATSEYHAHGFTTDAEKKAHADKVKREHGVTVSWHANKAGGSEALRYHGKPDAVRWASNDLNGKGFHEEFDEELMDEMINEVLGKNEPASAWIHDFVHSDNPKFAGKSKAERKKMALGAYYAKQRNEELDLDEVVDYLSEDAEALDELSKATLQSYRKKIEPDLERGYEAMPHGTGDDKEDRKLNNRFAGDERAAKRLMKKEETEQIDELSKATLGSYIKKASQNAKAHRADAEYTKNWDKEQSRDSVRKAQSREAGVEKAKDKVKK